MVEQQLSEDPDELQLLDECNSGWAEAWKAAAKQLTELQMGVLAPSEQEKKLVRSEKHR